MQSLAVHDPQVMVLSEPDDAAAANTRGHLFERFIAKMLADRYGFEDPSTSNLNVTAEGIELDVVATHRLTSSAAMAECKAYARNVHAKELTNFYGKLAVARLEDPTVFGLFCALPRLTPQGEEKAKAIAALDSNFKYLSAREIALELSNAGLTAPAPGGLPLSSDPAIVVTEHGIASACIILDEMMRTPVRVAVWQVGGAVPAPTRAAIQASEYAAGLPVVDAGEGPPSPSRKVTDAGPILLATVAGSEADFDYQFPAGPKFFVGRKPVIGKLTAALETSGTVVLNAQSGWGKSSLALKLQSVVQANAGYALVLDSRTADQPRYVVEVLRQAAAAAQASGLITLRDEQSWASLSSGIATLARATWNRPSPLLIFFDQFENVFRDRSLTKEFRDLALAVRDFEDPLVVGFAWKTDLVGWTEGHPYQLRDEIRNASEVVLVEPFGPDEVNTLLRRLEREAGQKLFPDLRSRLRAYSQGLPWLLKKLADHILGELAHGTTQEQLLAESLNVQALFQDDLAELDPHQHEILRHVARYAPLAASEVTERFDPESVQSLVDRRLIVQVGDRLDTYWDTFRDFLNTGRVPIQDSYILRQTPNSVARLLARVVEEGGSAGVKDLAVALDTSDNVVFNLSRELRLLGVTAYEPNRVTVLPEVLGADDPELELRRRVASALRKHRAYSTLRALSDRHGGEVSVTMYARELPNAFPAVEAAPTSWATYSRAFLFWISYAGLAVRVGADYLPTPEGTEGFSLRLLDGRSPVRARPSVPQEGPKRAMRILDRLDQGEALTVGSDGDERDSIRTLAALGAVTIDRDGLVSQSSTFAMTDRKAALRRALSQAPGGAAALEILSIDPGADPRTVGETIRDASGVQWSAATTHGNGGYFRSWAREAGVEVTYPRRKRKAVAGESEFDLGPSS